MGTIIILASGEGIIIYYLYCNSTKGWLGYMPRNRESYLMN